MTSISAPTITFARLSEVSRDDVLDQMSDPRLATHMPLLTFKWDHDTVTQFVAAKEETWRRDGLGHWAILCNGHYVGWGGFQKEADEWDFGLVLKTDAFGLGPTIVKKAMEFARGDARIPYVTFLLPLSRKNLGALERLGARWVGEVEYNGATFRKFKLDTK